MNKEHPITPPPELVTQWLVEWENKGSTEPPFSGSHEYVSALAARWGADQELEACCEWIANGHSKQGVVLSDRIRTARRPKPPSLKEQALEAAQRFYANGHEDCSDEEIKDDFDIIRRALELLPD